MTDGVREWKRDWGGFESLSHRESQLQPLVDESFTNLGTCWWKGSVEDEIADGFVGDSHVGAEFVYGEELVFGFVEGSFDFQDQVSAVAFTFSGDELDVFRVDADSGEAGFHRFSFVC